MRSAFEIYLRTGRRVTEIEPVETKFNPWHDPEDGRFTFAGQGRHVPGGRSDREGRDRRPHTGSTRAEVSRSAGRSAGARHTGKNDPKNPRNHSIYIVKRGDTLTKIASLKNGLTVANLVWLNELSANHPLQIGQGIRLPHQQFLDTSKRARDTFMALAHYIEITGGKLPPNPARPPSIVTQVEASGRREFEAGGYSYEVDVLFRSRHVSGEIRLKTESRSRRAQADAGKPDRRGTDDGGHFIAARFNGPREWFNHFAQDANFNRGAYRTLEDQWAAAVKSGKRVFVDIVPHYRGTSMRPDTLSIIWIVEGKEQFASFPNERKGK